MRLSRVRLSVAAIASLAVVTGGAVATVTAQAATAGCSVAYSVTSQWPGGFGANVAVTNLGDPANGWRLTWSFPAGQTITQLWNGSYTQSGAQVAVTNTSWNASLATGASAAFGFNGTWNGSNPAPTSFALNGVTCTGGVMSPPPTPAPPTSALPSASPSSGHAWTSSDQWGTWTNGGYTLYNDVWGSGAGTQTIWANSYSNWGVWANHPNTGGVKAYPNSTRAINQTLSALHMVTSTFNVTVPGSGVYNTSYDIWANNNAYEIMLWMNRTGGPAPLGSLQATVSVGGHTWQVYRGSNGANAVYSFVRTSNTTSGSVDIFAVLTWLRTAGWFGDVTLGTVQFGYEITSSSGGLNFTTNAFSVSSS